MTNLLPCPFCGKTHIIVNPYKRNDRPKCKWVCSVFCAYCYASTCNHGFDWTEEEARQKAIEAWNRRAGDLHDQT